MTGRNICVVPEPDHSDMVGFTHYQRMLLHTQKIQKSWIKDIQTLPQTRLKWKNPREIPIKVNQMVLLKQKDIKPFMWKIARVHRLLPDKEGLVRIAEIIKPAISEIYLAKKKKFPVQNRLELKHVSQLAFLPVDVESEGFNTSMGNAMESSVEATKPQVS